MLRIIFDKSDPVKYIFKNIRLIVTEKTNAIVNSQFEKITSLMTVKFNGQIPCELLKTLKEKELEFLRELVKENYYVNSSIKNNDLLLYYDESLEIDKIHKEIFTANLRVYAILFFNSGKQNITLRWKLESI